LGGGGGNGGFTVGGGISASKEAAGALSVGIGGFGGGGGDAGNVTSAVTGRVDTQLASSFGVSALSLGGGGGVGGMSIAGSVALSQNNAGTVSFGLGGFGGDGGDAGNVSLARDGDTRVLGAGSDGVLAQSIGGGGGNGGLNVAGALSVGLNGNSGSIGIGIGGFGGDGGNAGNVDMTLTGNVLAGPSTGLRARVDDLPGGRPSDGLPGIITTDGLGGHGVVAQSLGGGGGNGGLNVTGSIAITKPSTATSVGVGIGIGGFGGGGGDAGDVNLLARGAAGGNGLFVANGQGNIAVLAQSIGGGGGNGGINVAGSIASEGSLSVGIGGFGGDGGVAGDVSAVTRGDLYAAGNRTGGLVAQSIGGGGGNGGINVAGSITFGKDAVFPSVAIGIGGFGGDGNRAGNVAVDQAGTITVDGGYTVGLMAQSIGGGGGRGAINVAAAGAGSDQTFGGAYTVGVGGFGGDGADAGTVNVNSVGLIQVNRFATTSELPVLPEPDTSVGGFVSEFLTQVGLTALEKTQDTTAGLLAQSVGGGGGVGGFNGNLTVSPRGNLIQAGVGGFGGAGGNADTVSVVRGYAAGTGAVAADFLTTRGDNASGLVAQSIGGGGGIAGMNLGLAIGRQTQADAGTPDTYGATIVVGGSGGAAGNAADVSVRHIGTIATGGANSDAITAQSIGGGGGSANYSIGLGRFKGAKAAANIGIGGGAGDGGFGADVSVEQSGFLFTDGTDAFGIRAQSIGGGGGNTALTLALALSVENKLSFTMGRFGGDGGVGGDVTVGASGLIVTRGQGGTAIFAQSVGGGGGTSSAYSAGVTVGTGSTGNTQSNGVAAAYGLQGGTGAEAGDVDVTNSARLITLGANGRGIFAQSVGGGGGAGGSATSLAFLDQTQIGLAMGGTGGTGGVSGTVDVTNSGQIETYGDDAEAILAQSVGGGGGVGGMVNVIGFQVAGAAKDSTQTTMNIAIGGTGGTGEDSDTVTVANSAQLFTSGDRSYGVRAESIGGGGGSGGAVANVRLQGKSQSLGLDINVGGSGGTGGVGGDVSVSN
ncbi:beta strand repeat-containing protein, partial [Sandarakinorhabdus rubra]|uniref:beta strand repeat-containing protein n=1 Tax=Sandarakinorhabdus rubra TaxID=2672568 RepID=UPI001F433799